MEKMLTIKEFCKLAGISESLFFRYRANGEGPRVTKFGARVLVSPENGREWLKSREKSGQARTVTNG